MGLNPFGGGGALIDDIPFEPGKGLTHKLLNHFLIGLRHKSIAMSVQTIAMGDAAVQLVLNDAPGSGEVELIGNLLQVDPESSGAGENLTLPLASNMAGVSLIIKNTGGENVVVKDGVTTVSTVLPGNSVTVWSGGVAAWALYADNAVAALSEQRLAALNWAVDGKNLWAPPHVDDILTDVLVIWRGTAGTVTAGTLTLGKLEAGAYGAPVNQLAAADYDLTGLAVNTPTSLAAFLHGTVANRTFDSLDVLEAEITGLDIGDDGFIALIPVFSRP